MSISKITSKVLSKVFDKMKAIDTASGRYLTNGGVHTEAITIWHSLGLGIAGAVKAKDPESNKAFWVWLATIIGGPLAQASVTIGLRNIRAKAKLAAIAYDTRNLKKLLTAIESIPDTNPTQASLQFKAAIVSRRLKENMAVYKVCYTATK